MQRLYKRFLNNELNWTVNRDVWRGRAIAVRAEFERNRCVAGVLRIRPSLTKPIFMAGRNVHDPRELAIILQKAEADLAERLHPDPYRRECWHLATYNNYLTAMQRLRLLTERNGTYPATLSL